MLLARVSFQVYLQQSMLLALCSVLTMAQNIIRGALKASAFACALCRCAPVLEH